MRETGKMISKGEKRKKTIMPESNREREEREKKNMMMMATW